jgi:hypothetical protein
VRRAGRSGAPLNGRGVYLYVGAAFVHPQPTPINGQLHPGAVLPRRAALLVQERLVDLLNVDAAVLYGVDSLGDFNDLAGGLFQGRRKAGRR